MCTSLFAGATDLTLQMWDNSTFTVVFDNKSYDSPQKLFYKKNIEPGVYDLKITRKITGEYGFSELIFDGKITIPENASVKAIVNRHNMLTIRNIDFNNEAKVYSRSNMISKAKYRQLLQSLRNTDFDSDKMELLKSQINENTKLIPIQVYQLATFFVFEASKLKFVKFVYPFMLDKNQFYMVYSAFSYQYSIDELQGFIDCNDIVRTVSIQ